MSEIKPALAEAEWQQLLRQLPLTATVDRATCADLSDMATDQNGRGSRHALAALALYGEEFGFTREDVDDERAAYRRAVILARYAQDLGEEEDRQAHMAAAARHMYRANKIAALLPPEGE